MKKPELLVTPHAVGDLERLMVAGADAFLIGETHFGLRLAGDFYRKDVVAAVELAHARGKKVYVAMNAVFHNDRAEELDDYVAFLSKTGVDAIVFGDPAVLMSVRAIALEMQLHWNPEQTATNWFTANYWGRQGAKRAVMARELNLEALIETKEHAEVEIEVQVHGLTCMFQSKRTLVDNYMHFLGRDAKLVGDSRELVLEELERGIKYPVFQDENGTHIFSEKAICIVDELTELIDAGMDAFKIDAVLETPEYLLAVTQIYRRAIDLAVDAPAEYEVCKKDLLAEIKALPSAQHQLDTGFYFKETVY